MIDLGIVRPGTLLYIPFHTFDSNDPSASVTITGLATTDIEVYKDGSATQRASDAGYALLDTDGIDFDTTTGVHGISIDLANNTTAEFYQSGHQYWVVIASITVDAATVNFIAATFRIGYPDAIINTHIDTLASQTSFTLPSGRGPGDDDALNGCIAVIHDLASAVQIAIGQVSDYVGSTRTVTLAADPGIFTMAAGDNIHFYPPALLPTTAGRTLDVTATGEAGVDLGNVTGTLTQANVGWVDANSRVDVGAVLGTAQTAGDLMGSLGEENAAAAAGDPSTTESVMQYVKQLVNVLIGTAGIAAWPAAKTPANGVSIAEAVRSIVENGSYADGAIWIDTVNGTAGSDDYENGTEINPTNSLANAITLSGSLGINRFHIAPGSTITFGAESHAGEVWLGEGWTLALGTVTDCAGIHVEGATVSGVMAGTGTTQQFLNCLMGATSIIAGTHCVECGITGTQTVIEAGDVYYDRCYSGVAGSGSPQFDMGAAIANSNLNIRHYSGGVDLRNLGQTGTDSMSLEGDGQLTVNANCTGGTIELRGNWKLTDNGSATINTDDDTTDINTILADTNELQGDWADGGRLDVILDARMAEASISTTGGAVDTVTTLTGHTAQTGDSFARLGAPAGASVSADVAAMKAETALIVADTGTDGVVIAAAQTVATVTDVTNEVTADVTKISGSATAADNLEASALGVVPGACEGTPSTTVVQTDLAEATDDHYIGRVVVFTSGNAAGEASDITDYTGATGTITITAITTAPAAADTFVIV